LTTAAPVAVRASGTVLWRRGRSRAVEIAIVHRPKLADWSLPKGKCEPGETAAACAVRETWEETGFRPVLVRPLGEIAYQVTQPVAGRKVVTYFAGHADDATFRTNTEVDELRWLRPEHVAELLTYPGDREVVDRFTALPADTRTLLLVRHAKAGRKSEWPGPDEERPLSPAGLAQAAALRALLPLFGPRRVHAANRARCVETVAGLASDLGAPVVIEPLLSEEAYRYDPVAATHRLATIARGHGVPVVCGQGGAIPGMIRRLAERSGLALGNVPCKKASIWVLSFHPAKPHHLVAADYIPTALPPPKPSP
jgi:8-oxo-dGTP pyrophosphatase MutT (NUDIX family)/phosphohistidine phosphatase SixA